MRSRPGSASRPRLHRAGLSAPAAPSLQTDSGGRRGFYGWGRRRRRSTVAATATATATTCDEWQCLHFLLPPGKGVAALKVLGSGTRIRVDATALMRIQWLFLLNECHWMRIVVFRQQWVRASAKFGGGTSKALCAHLPKPSVRQPGAEIHGANCSPRDYGRSVFPGAPCSGGGRSQMDLHLSDKIIPARNASRQYPLTINFRVHGAVELISTASSFLPEST